MLQPRKPLDLSTANAILEKERKPLDLNSANAILKKKEQSEPNTVYNSGNGSLASSKGKQIVPKYKEGTLEWNHQKLKETNPDYVSKFNEFKSVKQITPENKQKALSDLQSEKDNKGIGDYLIAGAKKIGTALGSYVNEVAIKPVNQALTVFGKTTREDIDANKGIIPLLEDTYKDKIPFEKQLKQIKIFQTQQKIQAKKNKQPIPVFTKEQTQQMAEKLFVKEREESYVNTQVKDYFQDNVTDNEKFGLNVFQISEKKSLNDTDKNLLHEQNMQRGALTSLKNDLESLQKDFKSTGNKDLISEYNNKRSLYNELLNESIKTHDKYVSNRTEIGKADENLDVFKRDYSFLNNFIGKIDAATGDIVAGLVDGVNYIAELDKNVMGSQTKNGKIIQDFAKGVAQDLRNDANETREGLMKPLSVDNINNFSDFGDYLAHDLLATQAPNFALLFSTGGFGGATVFGTSALGNKFAEMQGEMERGDKQYSTAEMMLNPIGYGVTETASMVVDKMLLKGAGRVFASATAPERRLIAQGMARRFLNNTAEVGKKIAKGSVYEGLDEGATKGFQNLIDGKPFMEDIKDPVVAGGIMGAFMTGSPALVAKIIKPYTTDARIQKSSAEILRLQSELNNPNLDLETKEIIKQDLEISKQKQAKLITKAIGNIESLSNAQFEEIQRIEIAMANMKNQATTIEFNDDVNQETKKQILSNLKEEFDAQNQRRLDLLERGANVQLERLDEKEVIRLKDLASRELMQEQNPDGTANVTLNDNEISKRAIQIYKNEVLSKNKADETILNEQKSKNKTENAVEQPLNETTPTNDTPIDANVSVGDNADLQQQEVEDIQPIANVGESENDVEVEEKNIFNDTETAIAEIKSKNLTRVQGLKMGLNQAIGTYISTEEVNRYGTPEQAKKMEVKIENPLVTNDTGLLETRKQTLQESKEQFTAEDFEMYEIPKNNEITLDDLNDRGIKKLAEITTNKLKSQGYDSVYFPESKNQEGELVVFDREKAVYVSESKNNAEVENNQNAKGFVSLPLKKLTTSLKNFQGRAKEYSQQTYDRIVNEAKNGTLNLSSIPPIQIWKDPKTNNFVILAGHSRTKAFTDLANGNVEFSDKYNKSDFENINSQVVEAKTLQEAQKIAQESNQGAVQTVVDNAKYVRESLLPTFTNYNQAKTKLKDLYGASWTRIYAYAHLNPKGKAMSMLNQFSNSNEGISDDISKKIAEWAGKARAEFKSLTNAHEEEIFEYLLKNDKVKTYQEFSQLLNNRVNGIQEFNQNEPLNFENKVGRGSNEVEIVKQIQDLKNRESQIKKRITELQKFGKNLNETQRKEIKDLTAEVIKINTIDIPNAQVKQKEARQADSNQFDIFSQINEEIENGNITAEQVDEFVADDRKAEEIEPIVEVIEGKAESNNNAQLEEVIKEVDSVLKDKPKNKSVIKEIFNQDNIKDDLDWLDNLKLDTNNLSVTLPFLPQVFNALIDAIKVARMAGNSLSKAIEIARKELADKFDAKDIDNAINAFAQKANIVVEKPQTEPKPVAEKETKKPIDKNAIEKDSFEDMAVKMPSSQTFGKFLSGETTERVNGEAPTTDQSYEKIKLLEAFAHGQNIIEKAKEQFGDNYIYKILEYVDSFQLDPANVALIYNSLENDLRDKRVANADDITIKKQFDLVQLKRQDYSKSIGQALNMNKLQNMAYYGYDTSETTDLMFSDTEVEQKRLIERALESDADAINNEAEFQEKNPVSSDLQQLILAGVEKQIDEIYKKLPSNRRAKAEKTIKALEGFQKKLRNKVYDAQVGIPIALIDAGITVIKNSIKAGVEIADAIEIGINYIKEKYGKEWKNENLFRTDVLDEFKQQGIDTKEQLQTKQIVKNALIDAGFGREITVTKKDENGNKVKEKRNVLDWKQLAGEEGSVGNIKKNVEETLKKQGYSDADISNIQQDLISEYNNLRANIVEKSLNELQNRNAVRKVNVKATTQRIAELYNLGLFDKNATEYDNLLNSLLGLNDFDNQTYVKLKEQAKALSELYATKLDPMFVDTKIDEIQKQVNTIMFRYAFKKGNFKSKAVTVTQEFMNISQRMVLHSLGQIIQNPLSGIVQRVYTKTGNIFLGNDTKALKNQRGIVAKAILNDINANGGLSYGKVDSNLASRGQIEDLINNISKNKNYHRVVSSLMGKMHLESADSYFKYLQTNQYLVNNLVTILTSDTNKQGAMSKKHAIKYVSESLTGQSFENAKTKALELINEVNVNAGKELLTINNESVIRLADSLVKTSLVTNGKITQEQLTIAYETAHTSAGFDLGHEANNWLSVQLKNYNASVDKKVKDAIKQKNWSKASHYKIEQIFSNNIMSPFVGGGSNWIVLSLEKAGLNPVSLITMVRNNQLAKYEKVDLRTDAGMKTLKEALKRKTNAQNTNVRVAIGSMVTLASYVAWQIAKGKDDDDEKSKATKFKRWLFKNPELKKYFNYTSPTAVAIIIAYENDELSKELGKILGVRGDVFDNGVKTVKAIDMYYDAKRLQNKTNLSQSDYIKINEKLEKARGEFGKIVGNKANVPLPWRSVRDIENVYRSLKGMPIFKTDYKKAEGFVDGMSKGGFVEWLVSDPGKSKEKKQERQSNY